MAKIRRSYKDFEGINKTLFTGRNTLIILHHSKRVRNEFGRNESCEVIMVRNNELVPLDTLVLFKKYK